MARRKTQNDRAIEDLDQQILILQKAREVLVRQQQPKPAAKVPKASRTPQPPLLASA